MIEYKILEMEGRNSSDHEAQLNKRAAEGWKFIGMMGKSNDLFIFTREIKIQESTPEG